MKRVLVLYYSQSGETAKIAEAFAGELQKAGAEVVFEALKPKSDYPYPWRSVRRFFDTMPESVLGIPPEIEIPAFDPNEEFDLAVIVYPVWFLSPALAIQGFFRTAHATALRGTDVVTISVSRAMWQQASERMKRLLSRVAANHRDAVVVTHRGSPLATLISTPRAALFGKDDRLMGIFPKAGVAEEDFERVRALGAIVGQRLGEDRAAGPLLRGEAAIKVKRWLVIPELLGRGAFYSWAVVIRTLGRTGSLPRAVGVYAFPPLLVMLILLGLPATLIGTAVSYPFIRRRLSAYVTRLAAPTGEPDRARAN